MPSKIILKKSSVASKVPVAGDLDFGELAINYTDSKLYFKKADGSIDAFTSSAAAAPVTSVGGYTGVVTATNLLDAIKTVDGAGSGLDADTLDGLSSASFYLASNPNGYTSNLGTVTSVGATSPLVSSLGTTPTISIPAATASVNGYMTAAYASKLDGIAAGATNVTNTNQLTNGAGYITSSALSGYLPLSGGTINSGGGYPLQLLTTQRYGLRVYNTSVAGLGWWLANDANTLVFHGDSVGDRASLNSDGVFITTGSFRAPLFYDSNDTAYYLDPASSGKSLLVNGNIELTARSESWGEGIRINVPTAGTWGGVRFNRSGASGPGNWAIGYTGINSTDDFTWWSGSTNTIQLNLDHSANLVANGSHRAPIFYDSNDTGYYIDPNSTGTSYRGRGEIFLGPNTSSQYLRLGGNGGATDHSTVSTSNGNLHIDAKSGNNLYLAWYNGSDVMVGGGIQATIYYDRNDTSYFVDPHSTSYQRSLFLGAHDSGTSEFRFGEDSSGWYGDRWYWDSAYTLYRYSRYAGTDSLIHYHDTRDASRITYGRNLVFDNYGKGIVGTYSASRYQAVFSMGDSYKLPADGTSTGSLYGIAWSHPNAGGTAGNLNTHGALILENGSFLAALSGSIRSRDDMRTPIFYDSNNTGYYVDPASEAYLYGGIWNNGGHGNSSIKNRLLSGENGATTGEVRLQMWCSEPGNTWDWAGFGYNVDNSSNSNAPVYYFGRPNPNFGQAYMRFGTGGQWYFYTSSSSGTRYTNMYLAPNNGVETYGRLTNDSRVDSPIFYDSNDTGYYIDPNSQSRFIALAIENRVHITESRFLYMGGTATSENSWGSRDWTAGGHRYFNARSFTFNNEGYGSTYSFTINSSGNVQSSVDIRAPIFYDSNDTGYYVDPNGSSRINNITVGNGASAYLYMTDDESPGGSKSIHANSNYLGFLSGYGGWVFRCDNSGNTIAEGNVTAYSDERLKKNWIDLPIDFIENVAKVKNGTYERIDNGVRLAGSSAQDWLKLLPEVVNTTNDESKTLSLAYGNAALVTAIELSKRVVEQEARIKRLESLIEKLI